LAAPALLPLTKRGKHRGFSFGLAFDDEALASAGKLKNVNALGFERLAEGTKLPAVRS
jgi:hypothetical protein